MSKVNDGLVVNFYEPPGHKKGLTGSAILIYKLSD